MYTRKEIPAQYTTYINGEQYLHSYNVHIAVNGTIGLN